VVFLRKLFYGIKMSFEFLDVLLQYVLGIALDSGAGTFERNRAKHHPFTVHVLRTTAQQLNCAEKEEQTGT
jgi:hypothetical protein